MKLLSTALTKFCSLLKVGEIQLKSKHGGRKRHKMIPQWILPESAAHVNICQSASYEAYCHFWNNNLWSGRRHQMFGGNFHLQDSKVKKLFTYMGILLLLFSPLFWKWRRVYGRQLFLKKCRYIPTTQNGGKVKESTIVKSKNHTWLILVF
jgi:hypothetical protein